MYAPAPDVSQDWVPEKLPEGATMERGLNATTEGHPTGDYQAATEFFVNGLSQADKKALYSNIAFALRTVRNTVKQLPRYTLLMDWRVLYQRARQSS